VRRSEALLARFGLVRRADAHERQWRLGSCAPYRPGTFRWKQRRRDWLGLSVHVFLSDVNLTIPVDDALLEKARALAAQRGTSVEELVRAHLEALVGQGSGQAAADELLELMQTRGGHSAGKRILREEAYAGRARRPPAFWAYLALGRQTRAAFVR